ncbi:phosphopantothenoylcysteine decarboxylase/phosphopantothenate--cysteine ligase [Halobacteroides halobius DSM 5150]|uniref:Coenzyme A biosynthesis bifunctional protein CoaBC n=1 Tax=Halobacteroides halobius (strain ATCC 35273 / DSM 5150 / MD-1) TaxID=748449 RepID=L0K6F8_HALHC|nr:bifunctional phosphopantothenoylcysteine decarboxylase/phosphopantothenate--cysteine ligase CoaBC [Halobacteroides halobius]AGB40827.1 phosphopantothenoylcysteine decarboxylase/phosphopantothenate--cysteine ligase [Halobacteroides halobius DSM 5150]
MLKNKTIVVGITGGIAAYKAVEITSRLKKLGAEVHVIMTKSATEFVKPLTFRAISHNPVTVDMFAEPQTWDVEHISLAKRADLMLIAPATANLIGKIANGIADDMLSTTVMATQAEVVLSPAMNVNMYQNPIVQENLSYLEDKGYQIIEADKGYLACGDEGRGRFPKPEEIVKTCCAYLLTKNQVDLAGKKVLVTAGGTKETIDPVRFLANHSSGKMGYALARAARARGADVTLISAPTNLNQPKGTELIEVTTAAEMYQEVMNYQSEEDIIIMAAAVADYRISEVATNKIKKNDEKLELKLERTKDILAKLGQLKQPKQVLVGFAAETNNLLQYAKEKLEAKNADLIVANDITGADIGFGASDNQVTIISTKSKRKIPQANKLKIATQILDEVSKLLEEEK